MVKKLERIVEDILVANAKFEYMDGLTHIEAVEVICDAGRNLEKIFPDICLKVDKRKCPGCNRLMNKNWEEGRECRECR